MVGSVLTASGIQTVRHGSKESQYKVMVQFNLKLIAQYPKMVRMFESGPLSGKLGQPESHYVQKFIFFLDG